MDLLQIMFALAYGTIGFLFYAALRLTYQNTPVFDEISFVESHPFHILCGLFWPITILYLFIFLKRNK